MEGYNAEFHAERAKMDPVQSATNLRNRALFLDNVYIRRKKSYRMASRRIKWVTTLAVCGGFYYVG